MEQERVRRDARVRALAEDMNVRVDWSARSHLAIEARDDCVIVMPCASQREYLGALHELGHHACGHVQLRDKRTRRLDIEAEAWRWALRHSDEPLEATTYRHIEWALGTYQRTALRFGIFGEPGETFWQLAREVRDNQRIDPARLEEARLAASRSAR